MARLNVNPTRMELTKLKNRLMVATRGHKLLKDKNDGLMKQFLGLIRRNRELRERVEAMMMNVHSSFLLARAVMPLEVLEESLMFPKQRVTLDVSEKNLMSVNVPVMKFVMEDIDPSNVYPYGFATTSGELDDAISVLSEMLPSLLELAEMEKSAQLLSEEIDKTRRRVNALEHVMIPGYRDTIAYIVMKLEENERSNLTRLMKVKDMMLKEAGYGRPKAGGRSA
jgi:V/A-type H+-transporting ATPase subunit D